MLPYKAELREADGVVFGGDFQQEKEREKRKEAKPTKQIQTNKKGRAFWLKL